MKNKVREFDRRSLKQFPLVDHFINSHYLFSWWCIDIVRRMLILVTHAQDIVLQTIWPWIITFSYIPRARWFKGQSDLKTDYAMDIFVVSVFLRWLLMVFCFRFFFFCRENFMVQSRDGCSLVVRKQYYFVKTIFLAIKLSTRCAVLHPFRVVSHEIAQIYMAARKGFKVHLIAAMQFVLILSFLKVKTLQHY